MKEKRITVKVSEEKHRKVKSKLAKIGTTITQWIQSLVDELIKD